MRLFTSNTKYLSFVWFAVIFAVLLLGWEAIIRANYNPPLDIRYEALAAVQDDSAPGREALPQRRWVIVGNCLVLQGLSPRTMLAEWRALRPGANLPVVLNIARHEHGPQAFLAYFEKSGFVPDVIVANISSWINTDNFSREAQALEKSDPLRLRATKETEGGAVPLAVGASASHQGFGQQVEDALDHGLQKLLKLTEKRYQLFDFGVFCLTFFTTGDLKGSLYELNLQSWFKVTGSIDDGMGYHGVRVEYEPDWDTGVQVMASKRVKRLKAGGILTSTYWQSLSEQLERFRRQGTRILLIRMPESPTISRFNEGRYSLPQKMQALANNPGVAFLDLNTVESLKTVKLYDAVHADREGSLLISEYVAKWLAEHHPDWVYGEGPRSVRAVAR